ncbi:CU044_5270 family protein [Streptomyces sp. NPDC101237]|uniref:CU044_5270 family protein n=1 Tax=Streptomyces sp. NPDC101237 TaxID=3366139 RepID=UPI0037FC3916
MNAFPQRGEETERQAMADQFPATATHGLSSARTALLEEHLMREITRTDSAPVAVAPRRPRWAMVAVPVAVAAVATAVVLNVSGSTTPAAPSSVALSPVVKVLPASAQGTSELMRQVAVAAVKGKRLTVRADQYVYVKSEVGFSRQIHERTMDGPIKLDAVHERQVWLPEDPARPGLIREGGQDEKLGGGTAKVSIDGGAPTAPGADNTTYAQLAALPTDPDVLLKKIYAITEGRAPGRDAAAFDWVGETIGEAIVRPKVEAAIWLAAGKIPGVEVVHNAVDAAGRHGDALAFESLNERTEYIFDKTTHAYLGERSYLVKDSTAGKAGQLTGISAVLGRGVADKIGEVPSGGNA